MAIGGERYQAVSRSGAEEIGHGGPIADERGGRESFEETAPVRARSQAGIEDGDHALVLVTADEPAEPLAELEHRGGERVVGEPVAALARDSLAARLDEGIPGSREGELVHHEERERFAGHVHALPERRGREEHGVHVLPEALEETLARCFPLNEKRERKPVASSLDQFVERPVRAREDKRSPAGKPAERDDFVREPSVIAQRPGLGEPRRHVEQRLVAKGEWRREDELMRFVEPEPPAQEASLECRRDEDRGRTVLPECLAQELRDVDRRPREGTGLRPGNAVGISDGQNGVDVAHHRETSPGERVGLVAGSAKIIRQARQGAGEKPAHLPQLRGVDCGEAPASRAGIECRDELDARAIDLRERAGRGRALLFAAVALHVAGELAQPAERDASAEPRGGGVFEPMRLVEDDGVVLGQDARAVGAPAEGEVGEIERVVRDYELGAPCPLSGRLGEAGADVWTPPPSAAVGADR